MNIAVLTFHRAYNCGAMLQAWALKTVLEKMGHTVQFPILNHVGESNRWAPFTVNWSGGPIAILKKIVYAIVYNLMSIPIVDILYARLRRFRLKYLPEVQCVNNNLDELFDVIVVGSDQVWSEVHTGEYAKVFFGEALPANLPKIAYAASYGDNPLCDDKIRRVACAIDRFDSVSVREYLACYQLQQYCDKRIEVTLDPTLLLEGKDYLQLVNNIRTPNEPYLFMYTLYAEPFFVDTAFALASKLGLRAIIAPMYQYSLYKARHGLTYCISPDRLVAYIANAKYVLAGSFHGTALATIFHKQFLSLRMRKDVVSKPSRVGTLLKTIGQMDRLVTPDIPIDDMVSILQRPIEDTGGLDAARRLSICWLRNHLRG